MSAAATGLAGHLGTGATTVCRCWSVARQDGVVLGFTDHDVALSFDGISFEPEAGMSGRALEQLTGLAVDNSEAVGIISSTAISEADILAGRLDGAEVKSWLVNWADVTQRQLVFRGSLGEIERTGTSFSAELRGLTEWLNQPQGRVFQKTCPAVLGDGECAVDLDQPGLSAVVPIDAVLSDKVLIFQGLDGFADRWFERGKLTVMSGNAAGLHGVVKNDRSEAGGRRIELWTSLRAPLAVGDSIRLDAGCDKRAETCRLKFANLINFRGFPLLPGDDWLAAVPRHGGTNTGGSLAP